MAKVPLVKTLAFLKFELRLQHLARRGVGENIPAGLGAPDRIIFPPGPVEALDERQAKIILCARVNHHIVRPERIERRGRLLSHIENHAEPGFSKDSIDFPEAVAKQNRFLAFRKPRFKSLQNMA
jgi:hypothetical protein